MVFDADIISILKLQKWRCLVWYKTNGETLNAFAFPTYTEELMEWQRYKDRMTWSASGFEDGLQPNQIGDWSLRPTIKTSPMQTYIVDDEKFNPSAELARVFENISQQIGEGHDTRPPLSYLMTCCQFMWVRNQDKRPLTETKQKHNDAFSSIQTFTQTWSTNWGQLNNDNYVWQLKDFLQLSARFYYFYSNSNVLVQDDIDEINDGIRLHCDVGLNRAKGTTDYSMGVIPKNLLGYCWKSLANDIANKKEHRMCASQWCTRVFKENIRPNKQSCGNSCSTSISRSQRVKKAHEGRESIFIEVGQ